MCMSTSFSIRLLEEKIHCYIGNSAAGKDENVQSGSVAAADISTKASHRDSLDDLSVLSLVCSMSHNMRENSIELQDAFQQSRGNVMKSHRVSQLTESLLP